MLCFTEWILLESKQDIINLKYPPIIATVFYEKFGNLAFTLAKWFRDYKYQKNDQPDNWWLQTMSKFNRSKDLYDLTYLYEAAANPESYKKALDKYEIRYNPDEIDESYLEDQKRELKKQITDDLLNDYFFKDYFIKDVINHTITDLAPYKNLTLFDAESKYDKKKVFKDKKPIKVYQNGYKWIDVGKRCHLMAHLMKNCGSSGLMSMDADSTILGLFDPMNKPHVMVTYSPNENRISGAEGAASTEAKEKYHEYILDITETLNARFDTIKSRSDLLNLKYLLRGKTDKIERLGDKGIYDQKFKFDIGGKNFYTNSHVVVNEDDLAKIQNAIKDGSLKLPSQGNNLIDNVFSYRNQPVIAHVLGIHYIILNNFIAKV